jgi:hypothetical protein
LKFRWTTGLFRYPHISGGPAAYPIFDRAPGFRFDLKALSSDVCEYRDGNGEFRTGACRSVGPDSCQAVSGSFLGATYAATAGARPRHGAGMMSIIPVDFFGACAIFL